MAPSRRATLALAPLGIAWTQAHPRQWADFHQRVALGRQIAEGEGVIARMSVDADKMRRHMMGGRQRALDARIVVQGHHIGGVVAEGVAAQDDGLGASIVSVIWLGPSGIRLRWGMNMTRKPLSVSQ